MKQTFSAKSIQLLTIACLIVLVSFNVNAGTSVFVVTGKVTNYDGTDADAGLKVVVSNVARPSIVPEETTVGEQNASEYRVTFIEIDTGDGSVAVVADVGDSFKVEIRDANDDLMASETSPALTQTDIDNAMISIDVEIPPSGMTISPPGPLVMDEGDDQQFSVEIEDYRGSHATEATDVDWDVTGGGIGSIADGLFSAETAGVGHVKATYDGITAQVQITVGEPPPQAIIEVDKESIDFGEVDSKSENLTISNTGTIELSISGITVNDTNFRVEPDGQIAIAADESTQITVIFDSQSEGTHNAMLTITSNANNEPEKTVDLIAEGPPFEILSEITFPTSDEFVHGTIDILGTAKVISGTLKNWQLYYSPGDQILDSSSIEPSGLASWERLIKSTDKVDDDLLYSWDTTELNQSNDAGDVYTLRLWVDSETPSQQRDEFMVVFTIDNSRPKPPTIGITSEKSGGDKYTTNNDTINVAGSLDEPNLTFDTVTLQPAGIDIPKDHFTISGTSIEGSFPLGTVSGFIWISITVKDDANNISTAGNSNRLRVDNDDPTVVIQQPAYGANFQSTPIELTGIASEQTSEVVEIKIKLGDGEWKTISGTTNWSHQYDPKVEWPGYEDTDCHFKIRAYDSVGNFAEVDGWVQFYFDDPTTNISQPIDGDVRVGDVPITGLASGDYVLEYDDESDGTENWIEIESGTAPAGSILSATWNPSGLEGFYTLRLTVTENGASVSVKRTNLQVGGTYGDVNSDGLVNVNDANAVLQHVVGRTPAGFIEGLADVSDDGEITAYDAALIFQKAAGLIE